MFRGLMSPLDRRAPSHVSRILINAVTFRLPRERLTVQRAKCYTGDSIETLQIPAIWISANHLNL